MHYTKFTVLLTYLLSKAKDTAFIFKNISLNLTQSYNIKVKKMVF